MRLVDPGSIVHASDPNGLVTVTQMQPIAVLFSLPQDDLPAVLAGQTHGKLPVAIEARDGTRHLADGQLIFIDSQVDQANGQVRLKANFVNADRALWPGAFVIARVQVRTDREATVVPDRAVQRGESGPFVYLVRAGPHGCGAPGEAGAERGRLHRNPVGRRAWRQHRLRWPVAACTGRQGRREADRMRFSEIFIRRRIGTSLLAIGVVLIGMVAYFSLPVAPLPQVDFPTIKVDRTAAGRECRHHGLLGRNAA